MRALLLDRTTLYLVIVAFTSLLIDYDFFYGFLLFVFNFLALKFFSILLFEMSLTSVSGVKLFIVIPAVLFKFIGIALISYYVLVHRDGNPFLYTSGFGVGLFIVAVLSYASSKSRNKVERNLE
jgi:hypothetical protein